MSNRELDAAVAAMLEPMPARSVEPGYSPRAFWYSPGGGAAWAPTIQPSRFIDSALRAYEEFRKQRGWKVWVIEHLNERDWRVILEKHTCCDVFATDASLARALCLALLAAAKREG